MSKPVARYMITSGLAGCYIPDCNHGAREFTTRREFAHKIRDLVSFMDWPQRVARQVSVRTLWSFITRNGSSCAHFTLNHKGCEIAFHGLTAAEYHEAVASDADC